MQKPVPGSSKVNAASLIDLKAELFRKQEEFKVQKLQNQNTGFIRGKHLTSNKKPSLFSKKNPGVSKRAEKDYEEKVEEENVFERSRKALENKAKLYEKIASGTEISEEDGTGVFLVDFQKKNIDHFENRLEKERKVKEERERREIEEEQRQLAEPVPLPASEEEEWVDYVDAFGRSRRCLRKDLPDLQRQDETLQVKKRKIDQKVQKGYKDFQELREKTPSLLSDDMKREIERQSWEKQEMEKMLEEKKGPTHYADVQHNEIRTHGVGFYKFDKDEDVRQEQMEQLNTLRQQTKDERSKSERIKEKRKAALAARLAKVKQRKREKLGLPETPEEDNVNSDEEIGPKLTEQVTKEPDPLTRDDSWRATVKSTREWDKGKHLTMERSEEVWLEKQRAEREKEFAPPTFYYDTPRASKTYTEREKTATNKQNKLKTTTATGGIAQGNEMESLVEKQLSQIRKNVELESSKTLESFGNVQTDTHSSGTCKTEGGNTAQLILQSSTDIVSSGFSAPFQNNPLQSSPLDVPLPDVNFPPPNLNVPPPNLNVPPPNYQISQQAFSVPPLNFNIPPPNFSIPPPHISQSLPNNTGSIVQSQPISNFTNVPNCSTLEDIKTNIATELNNADQPDRQTVSQEGETRKKFVPKMDIIDTRLMDSEND